MNMQEFYDFFWAVFQAMWVSGTVITAIVGLWAVILPKSFLMLNRRLSRWSQFQVGNISTLDKPRYVDWFIYRHHVIVGVLMILGSFLVLFYCAYLLDYKILLLALTRLQSGVWVQILTETLFGLIYIVSIVALIMGSVIFIRPSVLKKIEIWSNRWVSTESYVDTLEHPVDSPDRWVEKHPQVFGVAIVLAVLYISLTSMPN